MFVDITKLENKTIAILLKNNIKNYVKTLDTPLKYNLTCRKYNILKKYINDLLIMCTNDIEWSLESSGYLAQGVVNMLFIMEQYDQFSDRDNVSEIAYDFIINQLDETHFWNPKFLNIGE